MRNTMRHFPDDEQRPPVIENSALLDLAAAGA
jgi:hypothetical protein